MSNRSEAAIGFGCYVAYLAARARVYSRNGERRAIENAQRIHELERRLGIDVEQAVQRRASAVPAALKVLNAGYVVANIGLSVGWLVHLYRSNDPRYRRERTASALALVGALPIFVAFPTAPPRDLDGFVDTLAEQGLDLSHPFLTKFYNPIAAMPSHHVAFATVTGLGIATAKKGWRRAAWRSYPAGVTAVVLATGNHFVADALVGVGLGKLARRLVR